LDQRVSTTTEVSISESLGLSDSQLCTDSYLVLEAVANGSANVQRREKHISYRCITWLHSHVPSNTPYYTN